MLKMISNVVRGRGEKAPALFARPKALLGGLARASRGYALMGAGVIAAAVVVVSLLTFLAPDSDRPLIGRPIGAVQSVVPGVLEQVEDRVAQAATLLGVDKESIQNVGENMSAGLAAARSGISTAWAPIPGIPPAAGTAPTTPAPDGSSSSSPATDESSPPQTASEPLAPSSSVGVAGETSSPASPPATEAPFPIMSEPTSPPAVEEEPPPATEEPPPAVEEPSPPPTTEEPPPPPDEPAPPTVEQPPPATNQPKA
jgi:molecular chaperone DnaK